jgi:hypothetical protein
MATILEKARLAVGELLERRHRLRTYEDRVQYALDLVRMHFELENLERTDDAEWEVPARRVSYNGALKIRDIVRAALPGDTRVRMDPCRTLGHA